MAVYRAIRCQTVRENPEVKVKNPFDVAKIVRPEIESDHERMFLLGLSTRNRLRLFETLAVGGIQGCVVDTRVIFRRLLTARPGIVHFALAHNHPGNDVSPSLEDIQLTARIREASEIVGVILVDHIILPSDGSDVFYSFKAEGHLG